MFLIEEIVTLLNSLNAQISRPKNKIENLLIDSRKIIFPEKSIFFALKGKQHDGHQFIGELYQKGVQNFVLEGPISKYSHLKDANILQVQDVRLALQQLAQKHREKFNYPVISITGSNGKTIVKEWLAQLLGEDFKVIKSPKSYNSQVGVPLSLWQMNDWYDLGIFEAGISQVGEMENLQKIIQPSIGIFTNIGTAHDEGFQSCQEKIREKLKLFQNSNALFYCEDYQDLTQEIRSQLSDIELLSFSFQNQEATLFIQEFKNSLLRFLFKKQIYELNLSFSDTASVENVLHCILVMLYFEVPIEEIQKRILRLQNPAMRLSLREGIHQSYLIDDSYNNDWGGLQVALDFLEQQAQKERKVVILSDVLQTGTSSEELYQAISELLNKRKIDFLIGVGEEFTKWQNKFSISSQFYQNTQVFLENLDTSLFINSLVLIKGARIFEFEKVVQKLQKKTHRTVLEINLDALAHNLNFYRQQLSPQTKLMVMVKAFAYGSGSAEVAHLLQYHRVDYLAVAYADEGVFLRENGVQLPILVLNPTVETFEQLLQYNLEPELYSFNHFEDYLKFYKNQAAQKSPPIHLKLDTGMHRLGFMEEELPQLLTFLKEKLPWEMRVASVFTHLAGSDEGKHENYSQKQIQTFQKMANAIEEVLGYSFIRHALNSPGILRYPEAHLDMVRLGIGLYGVEANQQMQAALEPIGTLKTTISQIKDLKKGDTIGYGRTGVMEKDGKIATIAIGYADGFSRALSQGRGEVLIRGQRTKVIGNVCMDMTMVDVSDIRAEEGDEVIIFSPEFSLLEMAEKLNTIPYTILTSIGERVKRVFYTG